MMPETAVGKDDALVRVDDEIRTPGKRGILNPEFKPDGGQEARDPFSIAVSRVPMARMFYCAWPYCERPPLTASL